MAIQRTLEDYERDFLEEMYELLQLVRTFEDRVQAMIESGELHTDAHLCQGQEAVAVGTCLALDDRDAVTSTHRPHGHVLAMGSDPNRVMAEIGGKETGLSGGRGGEMHMFDPDNGLIASNAVVGASVPHAVGAALANQMDGTDGVVVAFYGDGAANQGVVHEAMNIAGVWDLPVLFLCENNQYAVTTAADDASAPENLSDRAAGYGMPGKTVDGQDALTVYEEVSDAVTALRNGGGPQLIECETYRYLEHTAAVEKMFSDITGYRTDEEKERWHDRDPVTLFRDALLEGGRFSEQEIEAVEQAVDERVDEAVEFMENSDDPRKEDALNHIYRDQSYDDVPLPRHR